MNETAWEKIANTHCVKRDKINYFEAQVLLFSGSNIIIFSGSGWMSLLLLL